MKSGLCPMVSNQWVPDQFGKMNRAQVLAGALL
jgi:hypothetical protein